MADGQQTIPPVLQSVNVNTPDPFTQVVTVPSDPGLIPYQPVPQWSVDPEIQAAAVHHARLATGITNAINILGGGDTMAQIVRQPDGSYLAVPKQLSTAGKWGRVAAAALAGATQGFAAGQGPGGQARAAAAGMQAGMQIGQGNQDQTLALAERTNKQVRDRQLFNANMALLNQRIVQGTWNQHQLEMTAAEGQEDRQAQIQKSMRDANAELFHIDSEGNANTLMDRLAQKVNTTPELLQAHNEGRLATFTTYGADKKPNGMDIYMVPVDQMNQLNDTPHQRTRLFLNNDGTVTRQNLGDIIPAQAMKKSQLLAMTQADADADNKTMEQSVKFTGDLAQANIAKLQAEAARKAAGSAAAGTWELGEDEQGQSILYNNKTGARMDAGGIRRPGTRARLDAATQKILEPINNALEFANRYAVNPNPTGPSDEALMEKFFDLAKPSSGFRMSQPQIDMLQRSQNWQGSLEAKWRHFNEGTWFSKEQRAQIIATMNDIAQAKIAGHIATVNQTTPGASPTPTPTPTPTPPPTGNIGQAAVQPTPNPPPQRPPGTAPDAVFKQGSKGLGWYRPGVN
jgi:hypothetical protein